MIRRSQIVWRTSDSYLEKFLVLLPFLMVFAAEILHFTHRSYGTALKAMSVLYMLIYSFGKNRFPGRLVEASALFLPFFIYHILISFNLQAAFESALRYVFPIAILFYSYAIRKYYKLIIGFILVYALLSNLYQVVVYYKWAMGVPQWFYSHVPGTNIYYGNKTMGILRGVGLLGFFATYGFLNLIAFFLTREFYSGRYKKLLLLIFAIGLLCSISFKAIGTFLVLLVALSKHKLKLLAGVVVLLLATIFIFPEKSNNFKNQVVFRVKTYITEGNSARAESYRVMFNDIAHFRLFGRGVGSFGGAASTTFHSPVYQEVGFNWYDTPNLATTDTYFPHLFVEMGLIGGLLYLLITMVPLLKRHYLKSVLLLLFAIYFGLFFESFFSFALNNTGYLMLSLVLIYPILQYEKDVLNEV